MITMDYRDAGAYAMFFFMIIAFILLIPVFWVGDLGIALIETIFTHPNRFAYIFTWLIFAGSYYFFILEGLVARVWMKHHSRFDQLVIFYLQGIIGAYILSSFHLGRWSELIVRLINHIFGGVFNWLFY